MTKKNGKLKMQIAHQIKYWREKRGITQHELAKKIGVASNTVISGYENGIRMPSILVLEKIARALKVEVVVLFTDSVK